MPFVYTDPLEIAIDQAKTGGKDRVREVVHWMACLTPQEADWLLFAVSYGQQQIHRLEASEQQFTR